MCLRPLYRYGTVSKLGRRILRTFNRNFEGRSGTADGQVYLVSPETAAASAINGYFTNPQSLGEPVSIELPEKFLINDNMIVPPAPEALMETVEIKRGPNIKPFPVSEALPDSIEKKAVLKVGDNITTDHIMPAGAQDSSVPFQHSLSVHSLFRCLRQRVSRAL